MRLRRLALLMLLLVASGCPDPMSPEQVALETAAAQWRAARPSNDSYILLQRRLCFCLRTDQMRVTVTRGKVTDVVDAETGAAEPSEAHAWYRTVDQLFTEVRTAQRTYGTLRDVTYHPTLGYPTLVSIDPIAMAADDEVAWQTTLQTRGDPGNRN
ncbi:MAG: hypothetical protein FJ361_09580 [Gemmatimonadetes bacterium]|nr:hypothetical protein [Gemmatimonadota bacterium]